MPTTHPKSDYERAASLLDAHPGYRVLRALPAPEHYPLAPAIGPVRTAAVIDVETIGLDADHPIIDLAIQRIAFDARGRIVRVGQVRQWFEDPGVPIPADIIKLTGITDADVAGQRIDDAEAVGILASTDVCIAHNAVFDAPRVERRLPAIAGRAWACSCTEVAWSDYGFDGRKLGHLLLQMGSFHQGHRAASDVWATVNLLGAVMSDGETALLKLVREAEQPSVKIEATNAPFEAKDGLKSRGYRWNGAKRVWTIQLPQQREADEREWLRGTCGCADPTVIELTWTSRHRT